MTEWQPIETAPKDGRYVLVFGIVSKWRVWGIGYYFKGVPGDGEGWICHAAHSEPSGDRAMGGSFTPSHWMPLPGAPQ